MRKFQEMSNVFAAQFGVAAQSVESLLVFLDEVLEKREGAKEAFLKNPDNFIKVGVEHWMKRQEEYAKKILDFNSPEFKKLADDVWEELNKGK